MRFAFSKTHPVIRISSEKTHDPQGWPPTAGRCAAKIDLLSSVVFVDVRGT